VIQNIIARYAQGYKNPRGGAWRIVISKHAITLDYSVWRRATSFSYYQKLADFFFIYFWFFVFMFFSCTKLKDFLYTDLQTSLYAIELSIPDVFSKTLYEINMVHVPSFHSPIGFQV
jgi:hypothetical protein